MHYLKDIECGLLSGLIGKKDIEVLAKAIAITSNSYFSAVKTDAISRFILFLLVALLVPIHIL
jgi:hypothetical protein